MVLFYVTITLFMNSQSVKNNKTIVRKYSTTVTEPSHYEYWLLSFTHTHTHTAQSQPHTHWHTHTQTHPPTLTLTQLCPQNQNICSRRQTYTKATHRKTTTFSKRSDVTNQHSIRYIHYHSFCLHQPHSLASVALWDIYMSRVSQCCESCTVERSTELWCKSKI